MPIYNVIEYGNNYSIIQHQKVYGNIIDRNQMIT